MTANRVFEHIVVLCEGNICRSPTAAALLRHYLPEQQALVVSAGLAACVGAPIDDVAREVLADHGLSADGHAARQLDPDLLRAADLVLVMDNAQLARMRRRTPEATGKVFLLDRWVAGRDIPDPYRQPRSTFERVYAMIDEAVRAWLPHL